MQPKKIKTKHSKNIPSSTTLNRSDEMMREWKKLIDRNFINQ